MAFEKLAQVTLSSTRAPQTWEATLDQQLQDVGCVTENPLFASELAKLNVPPAAAIPRSVKRILGQM